MSYLDRIARSLDEVRAKRLYRVVESHQPTNVIDFASNDYLALSSEPQVLQAFRHATRVGSGGARLLGGRHREHSLFEEEVAAWLGRERALLFSSGYLAALGTIPVLAGCTNAIYSDRLNHASLIDGMRLTRISRFVYDHAKLPPKAQREPGALIVTESIFSMDGDAVDLAAILADMHDDDVLLVDEAHAIGLVGPQGAGLAHALHDPRVIVMGTLSKSLGALGGFIAGPSALIELLVNTARTFIFDTALPPAVALAARVALSIVKRDDERRATLHQNVAYLRAGLAHLGFPTISDPSPIVPVVLGDEDRAVAVANELAKRRLYVPAIRPPTVPAGTSRLRFSLRSNHIREHIDLAIRGIEACIATS
jgi:8-amino-7-oxononanoate synthase